jgi:transposase InsO family protein
MSFSNAYVSRREDVADFAVYSIGELNELARYAPTLSHWAPDLFPDTLHRGDRPPPPPIPHDHPVASGGLPPVLALEVSFSRWAPKVLLEIRRLIREMSLANRLWGAPRIHGELLKLGIEVAQSTVAKYMARSGRGRSQTWKTFLHNHAAGIGAIDFLIVPTVGFRLLFVLVILRHQRRRLISLSVTANPTAEWIAHQITDAFPWNEAADHLIRDREGSYGQTVTRRLSAMGIRDHPTAARSPWQNGHAERLIGSIRRECLDHIVVFGETHLRRMLYAYAKYYNDVRTHLSLDNDSPAHRQIQQLGQLSAWPILGGLHHEYCRM